MKKYKFLSCWISGVLSLLLFVGFSLPTASFSHDGYDPECAWQYMMGQGDSDWNLKVTVIAVVSIIFALVGAVSCFLIRKFKHSNAIASACFFVVAVANLISNLLMAWGIGALINLCVFVVLSIALIIPFVAERLNSI